AACSAATLATDLTAPQPSGARITLTGAATCTGTPEYKFWVRPPGGSWTVARAYGASASFVWDTAGRSGGSYGLEIDVRDQGAAVAYDATRSLTYSITASPYCSLSGGITAAPTTAGTGSAVTFTAGTPGGCPSPEYRFWVRNPAGAWTMVRGYSTSNTYIWPGGGVPGNWSV